VKITFFYESGAMPEVGTGHKYRCQEIAKVLKKNGHSTEFMQNDVLAKGRDVLVIDHIKSQESLIHRAKHAGMKVALIDGHPDDVGLVDLSVSAFTNPKAKYKGIKYTAFPALNQHWDKYKPDTKSRTIFIGMGGFDYQNIAEFVLGILDELKLNAVVAKSVNHPNFKESFSRVEIFDEDNYYNAMRECVVAITNGGLTLFQALYYGMPSLPIAQYPHQEKNIKHVSHCCTPMKLDAEDIKEKIGRVMDNEYYRKSVSLSAQHFVDGKGAHRICSLIENI